MSSFEKLLNRFLSRSKDFSFQELTKLLGHFGYAELKSGKTSGSRSIFLNDTTEHIIRLHKPHPQKELKLYQIDQIIDELKDKGVIP